MKKLLLFLVLFIANCSWVNTKINPQPPSANKFVNRFPANQKSIIFFKLSSKYQKITFCKYQKNTSNLENCFDMKPANYYQLLMLEPRKYEIRSYQKNNKKGDKNIINLKFSKRTKKRLTKPELFFSTQKNQILFLGNLDFKSSSKNKKSSNENDFLEIKKSLEEKNLKKLKSIFKGHKVEIEILNKIFNGSKSQIDKFLQKS